MAYIIPGTLKSSVLIITNLKSVSTLVGHITKFPSDKPIILIQVPFKGEKAPEYMVLYKGVYI